jgi:hypothetical protein
METTVGLAVLAACPIIAGVVAFLMGDDSKIGWRVAGDGGVSRSDCAMELWL